MDLLASDPESAKFIVEFMAHLLYHLDVFGCRKVETLVDILFDMFNTLFTVGCANPENLKVATDMLKVRLFDFLNPKKYSSLFEFCHGN